MVRHIDEELFSVSIHFSQSTILQLATNSTMGNIVSIVGWISLYIVGVHGGSSVALANYFAIWEVAATSGQMQMRPKSRSHKIFTGFRQILTETDPLP